MIKWENLLLVAAVAIGASVFITAAFSLGMRWLTNARHIVETSKSSKATTASGSNNPLEVFYRIGSYAMFAVCFAGVIYGIYLIIPFFHLDK